MTSHNNVKQTVRKRSTVVSNEAASSQEAASLYDASQIQDRHKKHTNDLIRAVLNGDIYAILEMFSESLQIGKESLQWAKPINTNQTSNPFTRLGKDHIDGIWPLSAKPGRLAVFSTLRWSTSRARRFGIISVPIPKSMNAKSSVSPPNWQAHWSMHIKFILKVVRAGKSTGFCTGISNLKT